MNQERKKVLLVEDNPSNVKVIKLALESLACEVVAVFAGDEALKMAEEIGPDVILMDIQLPGMDGFEVTRRLRDNDRFKDTPIIMVTASATETDKEKGFEAGGTEYIAKPFRISALREVLMKYIK